MCNLIDLAERVEIVWEKLINQFNPERLQYPSPKDHFTGKRDW